MSDGLDHEGYTMAAIHERDGCPDGEDCRYCDTREAKLAEIGARVEVQREWIPGNAAPALEQAHADIAWLLSEIDRLESERRELQLRVLRLEREAVRLRLALSECAPVVEAFAESAGPCDHSVGICVCGEREVARRARVALGESVTEASEGVGS